MEYHGQYSPLRAEARGLTEFVHAWLLERIPSASLSWLMLTIGLL